MRLEAQMSGGGQERGLRSGTVPTHLVVGLGKACEVAQKVCVSLLITFMFVFHFFSWARRARWHNR